MDQDEETASEPRWTYENTRSGWTKDKMEMWTALEEGGIRRLYNILMSTEAITGMGKALEMKMTADFAGERRVFKLLCCMHLEVIKALIDGTFGQQFRKSEDFRNLLHEDDENAGIYVNTLLRGDEPAFMTTAEIAQCAAMIKRYMLRNRDDVEAIRIDSHFQTPPSVWKIRFTRQGLRRWIDKASYTEDKNEMQKSLRNVSALADTLQTMRADTNPDLLVPQNQSPLEVGWSKNVLDQLSHHRPPFSSTTPLLGLLASCMTEMGIQVDVAQSTILVIAEPEDADLGEILVTILSGAMVSSGGLNICAPGGSLCNEINNEEVQLRKIYIDKPILADNVAQAKRQLEEQERILDALEALEAAHKLLPIREAEFDKRMKKLEDTYQRLEEVDLEDLLARMQRIVAAKREKMKALGALEKRMREILEAGTS